ncbi:hypothetical protein KSC_090960 [Ktedonobacter sp. SOSP1-52]|nr:hypothetical protein KSC_090960 [Ktedonobacter sp. SOSP1-52]
MERYEILRTHFPRLTGFALPAQVIDPGTPLLLEFYDCSALSPQEQEETLVSLREGRRNQPLDLTAGPARKVLLVSCSAERHWLYWDMATLNADMQTCHILLQELSLLYSQQAPEEEEPLQYADLTEWLYDIAQEETDSPGGAYWLSTTRALQNTVSLPYEQPVDRHASFVPHALTLELPERMLSQMQALVELLGVSEKSLLLACWGIVLARLTDQTGVLIGTNNDGRGYQEVKQAVGLLARSLPLVYQFQKQASYRQVVQQVEETLSQADEWQEYFSWQFVEAEDSDAEEPFCPFGFSYEALPLPWQTGQIEWRVIDQGMDLDYFKVNMVCLRSAEGLRVALHYDHRAFRQQDIQRLQQQWQIVCEQVLANPDVVIDTLHLLTEQEKHLMVSEWNATQANYPVHQGIHKLFEAQARQHPQAPALRYGELLLSYGQLEQQANQLAHLLLTAGLQPGGHVALCLPRNHWTIISLLAVLKAGGVYIPLEVDVPAARLQALLQQLEPALILSSKQLEDRLPSSTAPVLLIEMLVQQLTGQPVTTPEIKVNRDSLAYIMYTSGSTGVPKGVEIRQESVSNYTQALCQLLEVKEGWHFATVSSLAADLGNTAIFCGLASGGCVHILPYELVTDAIALSAYAQRYPLDVLKIVPSHLQALLSSEAAAVLPRRRLILGGEALPWSLVRQIQQARPTCQIYNHYGPTEATIGAVVYQLGDTQEIQMPQGQQYSVPIGRPIANIQVYPLDAQLRLLPVGSKGELYIGGSGIARGYLSRPDVTAERFVPDPFSNQEGARLYRTGDMVRYRADGVLEFIGRQDTQVKLRGYRIELGEIEAQLRKLPDVKEAVVQLWTEESREDTLLGYVVSHQQPGPDQEQLRQALMKQLPAYMVPAQVLHLDALPLTTNGKVDRQRLPGPLSPGQEKSRQPEQMHTPVEEVMLGIWQDVLQIERISRTDNFFQLGGHSLLGTRVTARLQAIFGIAVPITWLFESPTVTQLSRRIADELQLGQGIQLPPIEPASRQQPLPLSFAQQRLWFLDQLEPGSSAYSIPQALRLRGPLDLRAFLQALHALILRHENLRTTFPLRDGQPIQLIHPQPLTPLLVLDLSTLPSQERELVTLQLLQQAAAQPFDLAQGPLLRYLLLRLAEQQEHVLLLNLHHIVSDGWSGGILFRELSILYLAALHHQRAALPPCPSSMLIMPSGSVPGSRVRYSHGNWTTGSSS